ncbi:TY3B-TY3B protein [Mycena indigotica]|uniref:TY3B-TY3B protein n=1 Tax=Mycena indigotica TaxID=2126181 RepID=A0A8H6S3J1_9AGAR|nr:TY3B-TY3B protein [Mycena indigotica]KAF7291192.1 TY3B-TY3B protein [Mycena indigotica]
MIRERTSERQNVAGRSVASPASTPLPASPAVEADVLLGEGTASEINGVGASSPVRASPSTSSVRSTASSGSTEQVETELLSSASSGSTESSASQSSEGTLRNGSSRRPSPLNEDDGSISSAFAQRAVNTLTPIFSRAGRSIDVFTDEALFQSVARLHTSFDPEQDDDLLTLFGIEGEGASPWFNAERADQLRDILRRFGYPHTLLAWENLAEAVEEVRTLRSEDVSLVDRGSTVDGNDLLGIPISTLTLLAHVTVAAQQILANLTTFAARNVRSSFMVDVGYSFLTILEGHSDATTILGTLGVLQLRLSRAVVHIRKQLNEIRRNLTGVEVESIASTNSTLSEVRHKYGAVPAEQEVWRIIARKDYRNLEYKANPQEIRQGIQSVINADRGFRADPYRERSGKREAAAEPSSGLATRATEGALPNPILPGSAPNIWAPSPSVVSFGPGGPIPHVLGEGARRRVPNILSAVDYRSGGPSVTAARSTGRSIFPFPSSETRTDTYQLTSQGLIPVDRNAGPPSGRGGPPGSGRSPSRERDRAGDGGPPGANPPSWHDAHPPRGGGEGWPEDGDPGWGSQVRGTDASNPPHGPGIWQINQKLPLSIIPKWDGEGLTAIDYLSAMDRLARYSSYLFTQVGQMGPINFEGLAAEWWKHLTRFERELYSRDWDHLYSAISSQFITPE